MPLHRLSSAHMAAVGVSLAAHAAVAWGVMQSHGVTAFAPQPDTAVNVTLIDAAELFGVPAPAPIPVRPDAPTPPEPKREAVRKQPTAQTSANAAPPLAAPAPPPLVEPVQAAAAAPLPPTVAPQPVATPAVHAEDPLVDYRRRVWAHLSGRAPAAPRGAGVAVAVFGLDETGVILFVKLGRSSGDPAFDRACLNAVRAAGPMPRPPTGARREDLVFELPVKPRRA